MKKNYFTPSIRNVLVSLLAVLLFGGMSGMVAHGGEKPEIFPQLGHSGRVQSVVFSPDGKFVLSGGTDKTIILWDLKADREVRRFIGHTDGVRSAVFSPDGKSALSGGIDKTMRLWDVNTGNEIRRFTGHADAVLCVAYSPDGKFALSSSSDKTLRLWNINTGRSIRTFVGHTNEIYSTAFSPDGRFALSGSTDKTIRLWDVNTGKELRKFTDHIGGVYSVTFSPDGKFILAGGEDEKSEHSGVIILWDAVSGKELRQFKQNSTVYAAVYSPDGKFVISAGIGGGISLWDINTGGKIRLFASDKSPFYSAAFSPDGRFAVSGGLEKNISIWDIASGKEIKSLGQSNWVSSAVFSSDGKLALTGNSDKTICLWDTISGKKLRTFTGHTNIVSFVSFSPDNRFVLSGSFDRTARLWDIGTGEELRRFEGNTIVSTAAFSPDGRFILLPSDFYVIHLWDLISGKKTKSIEHKSVNLHSVAFSPDGKFALSTGNNYVSLWDVSTGKEIRRFTGQPGDVYSAVFSPDGKFILAGGRDHVEGTEHDIVGIMRLWDVSTGKEIRKFTGQKGKQFQKVAFSPDGRFVLSGDNDKTMCLWDVTTGKALRLFAGHTTFISSVTFSPDGQFALSGSEDGIARVWDIATGKEIVQFIGFTDGEWVVITPEGYFNSSPGGAKYLNVRVGSKVYGIDQFYAKFYRPELVQLALAGKELPKGESLGDILAKNPAPEVRIISPTPGSSIDKDNINVSVKVIDSGGGIGNVMVYLNDSQVANETRGVIVKGKASTSEKMLSFTIPLMAGQNEIRVIAFNKENSMESKPAFVSIVSKAVTQKPNLYALVIGINTYRNQSISLTYAVPDATAFAGTLQKIASPLFEKVDIRTLITPATTTKEAITKAFEEVRQIVRPNDVFVFYDASHGVVDVVNDEEQYFLLTSNVLLLSSRHIGKDAIGQKELVQLIGNIPAQKKLVILDTCNSGKGGKEIQVALLQQTRGLTDSTAVKLLQRAIGSAVFSASSDTQLALEGYKGHGLFTYVLLEGLQGKADIKKDGYITVLGLADYVEENVIKLSEEVFKRQQTPTIQTGANFPIGKVR